MCNVSRPTERCAEASWNTHMHKTSGDGHDDDNVVVHEDGDEGGARGWRRRWRRTTTHNTRQIVTLRLKVNAIQENNHKLMNWNQNRKNSASINARIGDEQPRHGAEQPLSVHQAHLNWRCVRVSVAASFAPAHGTHPVDSPLQFDLN